jgi:hypothetical protein
MGLHPFTTPPLPPGTPPLPPLNANTHAGGLRALALSNFASLQNTNVDNLIDECFVSLPEMVALGDEEIPADQTNSSPLFPMGLIVTILLTEVDSTTEGTVLEGAEGGSIFPTLFLLTQRAHNSHITSNYYIFF